MKISVGDKFIPKKEDKAKFGIEIVNIQSENFFGFKYLHTGWHGNIQRHCIENNYNRVQPTLL